MPVPAEQVNIDGGQIPVEPARHLRRRCRCNFLTAIFWTILFRKISYPFRQIKKVIVKRSEKKKIRGKGSML